MKICGIQKLTLLDFPSKTACTVFTGGCNFLCPFCHNASLVVDKNFEEAISNDKFFDFLKKRKGILDGVCITGGEPLIHNDIIDFIERIKQEGYLVKLDTNGSFPDRLKDICDRGIVDYVAMDIKNSKEKYGTTSGIQHIDINKISESISYLMGGIVDFEFRTTAVKGLHTKDDFLGIAQWIKGAPKYFVQDFIDSGDTIEGRKADIMPFSSFSQEEMNEFIEVIRPFIPSVKIRGI